MGIFDVTDNLHVPSQDSSGCASTASCSEAAGAVTAQPGYARYDIITLARLRDYQSEIERASALLCKVQPDLIAGETLPVNAVEAPRSRWPFILTVSATLLFWVSLVWGLATLF